MARISKKNLTRAAVVAGVLGAGAGAGYYYAKMSRPVKLVTQDSSTAQSGLGAAGTVATPGRLQDQTVYGEAPIGNIVRTIQPGKLRVQDSLGQSGIGVTRRVPSSMKKRSIKTRYFSKPRKV